MNDFLAFLLLSLFVVMSPGIDTALLTKRTISGGKGDGFKMALGIASGCLVHTVAAAFGLSAILMKSAAAFEVVKYVGAVYLIYLGVTSFVKKKGAASEMEEPAGAVKRSAFKQGLFTNVFNPKVAVFFLTFLPQFVTAESQAAGQLMLMGVVYSLLSIGWFFVYVFFINYLRSWLMTPSVQSWMERATGVVLIGFGLKLAFEKR